MQNTRDQVAGSHSASAQERDQLMEPSKQACKRHSEDVLAEGMIWGQGLQMSHADNHLPPNSFIAYLERDRCGYADVIEGSSLKVVFLRRNLDTSYSPPYHVIPRRLCSGWTLAQLSFGSNLLRSAHYLTRNRQILTKGLKRLPSP